MADTWRIDPTGIRQTTQLTAGGQGFITVIQVPYVITAGPASSVTGTVNIPEGQYNPVTVAEAIQQQVDAHNAVAGL